MAKAERKSFREVSAEIEAQSKDIAYKIWLAGVGAYGRAYAETRQGAERVNETAVDFFEDLVERGAEIEGEVRERISSNDVLSKSRSRVSKAVEVATSFQEKQRERFETRMDRMRSVLGFPRQDEQVEALKAQIEALTAQVGELSGKSAKPAAKKAASKPAKKAKAAVGSEAPAARVARLTKKAAPTARKTAAKKPAAKPAAKKAPAKRKSA